MITPFHNMMLICPDTQMEDVQTLLVAFDEVLGLICFNAAP
jgi:glutamate-1-semialdehyde 2,1-aminomutase